MKAGFLLLWLTAIWKFLRNKYRFIYFNTKYYNHSLKAEPVSRIYDLHNTHFLGELQDKSNKNYLLALKFKKNIILDKMIFTNVGNTKNSNHFKDVISAITTNIAVKINNEVIVGNIKKQFEKKINKLLGSEKLKSILGEDSEKVIQNLKKFFK